MRSSSPKSPIGPLPWRTAEIWNFVTGAPFSSTTVPGMPTGGRSTSATSLAPGWIPSARARHFVLPSVFFVDVPCSGVSSPSDFAGSADCSPGGGAATCSVKGPLPSPVIANLPSASAVALPLAPRAALKAPMPKSCERSKAASTTTLAAGLPSAHVTAPPTLFPSVSWSSTALVMPASARSIFERSLWR